MLIDNIRLKQILGGFVLKVTYRLKLGQDEFEINADIKDAKEFFETMSFYSSLPKTAPGGATDLKLSYRETKGGDKYYSLVSESEKQEYKLGQYKQADKGFFGKGWFPLYQGDSEAPEESTQSGGNPFPTQPTQVAAPAAVVKPAAPIVQKANPFPTAPTQVQQPQAAPAANPFPAPTPQAASVNPLPNVSKPNAATQAAAADVLAKFGIKPQG